MRSLDRQRQEVLRLARAAGLAARQAETLRAGRRLVLHLHPDDVVVRASPRAALPAATRELALAANLARDGALVGPPLAARAGPHVGRSLVVTLWEHMPALSPVACSDDEHAAAYGALRPALDRALDTWSPEARAELPDFRRPIRGALACLRRSGPGLASPDRTLVEGELADHLVRLRGWHRRRRPVLLHGDPHANNLVRARRGAGEALLWVDLESACLGPVEWDLSAVPVPPSGRAAPPHDAACLAAMRRLRSACVVAWCAADASAPSAEAMHTHLRLLRDG